MQRVAQTVTQAILHSKEICYHTCTLVTFISCLAAKVDGDEADVERECCRRDRFRFDEVDSKSSALKMHGHPSHYLIPT